jgi:uncharacterized protein YggE
MRLLVAALLATCAIAQEPARKAPTVRAHGTATVTAKPDQVRVDVGVVTQAQTAQAAAAENAKQLSQVLAELKKAAGAGAQVQTTSYSVHPNYRYPKDGGTPSIAGYTATNVVQVTSPDIANASKIIDTATRTGANTIQGVQFTLKDEQAVRSQALAEAVRQAHASASAMASALGLKIARVVSLEDAAQPPVQPVREMMMQARAAAADVATPVEPGEIRVTANVILTAEVAP